MGASFVGGPQRLNEAITRVIRAAHVADLALGHQVVERPERLFDGDRDVLEVHLVKVDEIGVEAPERRLTRLDDVLSREPSVVRADGAHTEANGEAFLFLFKRLLLV